MIAGNSIEEVDASIEFIKERSAAIAANYAAAAAQQQQPFRSGTAMPSVPPVGPMEQLPSYEQLTPEDIEGHGHGYLQAVPDTTPTGHQSQPPTGAVAPQGVTTHARSKPWWRTAGHFRDHRNDPPRHGWPPQPVRRPAPATTPLPGMDNTAVGYNASVTTGSTMMGPAIQTIWSKEILFQIDAGSAVRAVRGQEDRTGHDAGPDGQLHALQQPAHPRRAAGRGRAHEDARHHAPTSTRSRLRSRALRWLFRSFCSMLPLMT